MRSNSALGALFFNIGLAFAAKQDPPIIPTSKLGPAPKYGEKIRADYYTIRLPFYSSKWRIYGQRKDFDSTATKTR